MEILEKKNRKELFRLMMKFPKLPIIPMVDNRVVDKDGYGRWMGSWGSVYIDEYLKNENGVYFKSWNDVMGTLVEMMSSEDFAALPDGVEECRPYFEKLPWEKAIIINIDVPPESVSTAFVNTKIHYLYRDASNYKQPQAEIIPGLLTKEQIDRILSCLDGGEYFIPSQVGFDEIRFGTITEDDHCWFELYTEGFEVTDESPTVNCTPEELVKRFEEAKGNWKEADLLEQ